MINRNDLVPINYYKKEPFYGSYKGMRYRVIKNDDVLLATVWPEPYNFESTADEKRNRQNLSLPKAVLSRLINGWTNSTCNVITVVRRIKLSELQR